MNSGYNVSGKVNMSLIPSLASLAAFERAAFYLSFSRAAEDLNRTPSAVSRAVSELEEKLECQLFRRMGRTVVLTEAGHQYIGEVRSALLNLYSGTRSLVNRESNTTIRIRSAPIIASLYIVPHMSAFEEEHPDIKLLLNIDRRNINPISGSFDIDIQLSTETLPHLNTSDLCVIKSVPICSRKLLKGENRIKTVCDLEGHTLIHDSNVPDNWEKWLKSSGHSGLKAKSNIELNDPLAIFEATRSGLGVSLTYCDYITRNKHFQKELVMPFGDSIGLDFSYKFSTHHNMNRNRIVALVYEWMRGILDR